MADAMTPAAPVRRVPWLALFFLLLAIISYWNLPGQWQGGVVYNTREIVPPMAMAPTSVGYAGGGTVTHGSVNVSYSTNAAPTPAGMPSVPPMMGDVQSIQGDAMVSGGSSGVMMPSYPMPYPGTDASANDTREFNKIFYNAQMQTRDVQGLTKRIETVVRGHAGRVDNTSSSPTYGSVSFVVPQDKFEEFRTELESLIGSRFLTVSVNSQNLLPQKQGLEQQQISVKSSISDLATQKAKLLTSHNDTLAALQSQIDVNEHEMAMLKAQTSTDPAVSSQIASRLLTLAAAQTDLNAQVSNENASYSYQRDYYDLQIKYANSDLGTIKLADQDLLDNVATVSGTVSVHWISLWEMALAYLPGYSIPGIFLLLAGLSYLWHRKEGRVFGIYV